MPSPKSSSPQKKNTNQMSFKTPTNKRSVLFSPPPLKKKSESKCTTTSRRKSFPDARKNLFPFDPVSEEEREAQRIRNKQLEAEFF